MNNSKDSKFEATFARTAQTFVVLSIPCLDVIIIGLRVVVKEVPGISFDVRIDDHHQLPSFGGQVVYHFGRVRKLDGVPSEVPFVVRVFDVQPHDVHGDIVFVEAVCHIPHIVLIVIVPATLMIAQSEHLPHKSLISKLRNELNRP